MIKPKIRPNVLYIATLVAVLQLVMILGMFFFLGKFVPETQFWTGAVVGSIVTLCITVIGVSLGGLVTTMATVAENPPPPTVPAEVHTHLMDHYGAMSAMVDHRIQDREDRD